MNYSFLEAAKEELEEAVRYYQEQREGLGSEFAQEITATITKIQDYPDAWAKDFKECSMLQDQAIPLWGHLYGTRRGNPDIGSDAPSSKARILEKTLMKSRTPSSRRSKRPGLSNRNRLRHEIIDGCREMANIYLASRKKTIRWKRKFIVPCQLLKERDEVSRDPKRNLTDPYLTIPIHSHS